MLLKPLQQNDFNCDITTLIADRTFSMFRTKNILPMRNVEPRVFLTALAGGVVRKVFIPQLQQLENKITPFHCFDHTLT